MTHQRNMTKGDFANWVNQRERAENGEEDDSSTSLMGQIAQFNVMAQMGSIQENFSNQLQELGGSLPGADGPLSSAFRQRLTHAIYLLFAAVAFGLLAVFIGLPTLILRPAKFVICMTLSTLCLAGSVIVLQKPSTFMSNLIKGGPTQSAPVVALLLSLLATTYVTIFVHKYLAVLFMGGVQGLCMVYYLASFVPGGAQGVLVVGKMGWAVLKTAATPCLFVVRKSVEGCVRTVTSG